MTGRTSTVAASAVLVVAALAAALALAGGPLDERPSLHQRVVAVASGLRCPTCHGQSAATSQSDLAAGVRAQVRRQLRAGRSPDEIRDWFVERYGQQILLAPSSHGIGLVMWLLPGVLLLIGFAAVGVLLRRGRGDCRADPEAACDQGEDAEAEPAAGAARATPPPAGRRRASTVTVCALLGCALAVSAGLSLRPGQPHARAARAASPAAGSTPSPGRADTSSALALLRKAASFESHGAYDDAGRAYRRALAADPGDQRIQVRLAFVQLRAGHRHRALTTARAALAEDARNPEALLVLGITQRANDLPAAAGTLRQFLRRAPNDPAAPQVRKLLRRRR